jgi:GNAT superfamily N-acetyltransferase
MILNVRTATGSDVDTIAQFNRQLALETEAKHLDPEVVLAGVRRALASPALCAYFIAEHEGQTVGQAMITYELTDWRDGVFWWIQSVYVPPGFRMRGVFRALLDHISSLARSQAEVRGLRLYVEHENGRAQQVYARAGFSPSGHHLLEIDWSGAVSRVASD